MKVNILAFKEDDFSDFRFSTILRMQSVSRGMTPSLGESAAEQRRCFMLRLLQK